MIATLFATWCEFADHIGSRICRHTDSCGRGAAAGRQYSLRKCSGCGVSGELPCRGRRLAGSSVTGDECAFESISEAPSHTLLLRSMILKVLVQLGGYAVFDRSADCITGKSSTHTPAKASNPSPVFTGSVSSLSKRGSTDYSSHSPFAQNRMLPMFSIWMLSRSSRSHSRFSE